MNGQIITQRSEMLLGHEVMKRLSEIRVIIFGIGGVGSWCAESLVRTGLVNLTIVDSDIICATNVNRQVLALSANRGSVKVNEMRERLLAINPSAVIEAVQAVYSEESDPAFNLESYDYVIDAIDSLKNKIFLIKRCLSSGINFYSSMGAAAKSDPSKIKISKLTNTVNCPLARLVRRSLRKEGFSTDFLCVYSDEPPIAPAFIHNCGSGACGCSHDRTVFNSGAESRAVDWCAGKKRINGALVHITGTFGFFLASMLINHVVRSVES